MIRVARRSDVDAVVAVHGAAFTGFFLTSLGPRFLKLLYEGYVEHESAVLLVAGSDDADSGDVVGFVAGTTRPEAFFASLRAARGLRMTRAALPALLRRPWIVGERLWAAARYSGEKPAAIGNAALLSSLAVRPGAAGRGIGQKLVEAFCREAALKGASTVYLTTDSSGNDPANAFYGRCGFRRVAELARPRGRIMNVYLRRIPTVGAALEPR